MAHGIRNFSLSHRCPICNGPDWCGMQDSNDGGEIIICQRDTVKTNLIGHDGNFYVYVADSKRAGASIFEEASQKHAKDEMKKGHNISFDYAKLETRKPLSPIDIITPLPNEKLNPIYNSLLDKLILEPQHREWLLKEGWTDSLMEQYKIRSFPESDFIRFKDKAKYSRNIWRKNLAVKLIEEYGSIEGVPGAFINDSGHWTFSGKAGILFPMYDIMGQLYRLRLRLDDDNAAGGKYRNFSSWRQDEEAAKQGFLQNSYHLGCQASNNLSFIINPSRDDMYIAYITEGEKKAILGEHLLRAPFISVPGVNSHAKLIEGKPGRRPIDYLKRRGIKILIIAFDADKKENEKVMASEMRTIEILRNEGFIIGLAEWDIYFGKGIDDLLVKGRKPSYVLAA